MDSIIVYAKKRGRAPAGSSESGRIRDVAYLDIALPPPVPLRIGQHVRVSTLTPRDDRKPAHYRGEVVSYTSEPADIEGRIIGIKSLELSVTELVIKNEIHHSLVEHAYLAIPHAEGSTITLSLWHWMIRTCLTPLLADTRRIPLDETADIVPRVYTLPRPRRIGSRAGYLAEDTEDE